MSPFSPFKWPYFILYHWHIFRLSIRQMIQLSLFSDLVSAHVGHDILCMRIIQISNLMMGRKSVLSGQSDHDARLSSLADYFTQKCQLKNSTCKTSRWRNQYFVPNNKLASTHEQVEKWLMSCSCHCSEVNQSCLVIIFAPAIFLEFNYTACLSILSPDFSIAQRKYC